jgi:hypothetical protein
MMNNGTAVEAKPRSIGKTGVCKYCKHDILWIDGKPFEDDSQTRHTFDICSQKRIARKSRKRKEALLAKKAGFEKIHADHPIGSYVVYYSKGYCEDRFVPLGIVVSHQKFKPKTAPLVVKAVGHGEYEHEVYGGKVVTQERYEEVLREEIKYRSISDFQAGWGEQFLRQEIYKLSHHPTGIPKEFYPEDFFTKIRIDSAKKALDRITNQERKS